MSKMTYSEECVFLNMIRQAVLEDPTLTQKIIGSCMDGTKQRLDMEVTLRANSEFALSMAYSLIPDSKMSKNPAYAGKIRLALAHSGAFKGTPFAKDLEADLLAEIAEDGL